MSGTERKPEDRPQKDRTDEFGEELNPFKNDDAPRKDPIDSNQFGTSLSFANYLLFHYYVTCFFSTTFASSIIVTFFSYFRQ